MSVRVTMTEIVDIFQVDNDIWDKVAKTFNRTKQSLDKDVVILQEWINTQPHLPKMLDFNSIRNFLILNKFSIEVAKQKIDNYYTVRSKLDEIYKGSHPKLAWNREFSDAVYLFTYPHLTDDMYRICYYKVRNPDLLDKTIPIKTAKRLVTLQEMRLRDDVTFGDILVVDCENLSLSVILHITPTLFYRSVVLIYEKVFSFRVKAIYIINLPSFGQRVLDIGKSVMKPKVFQRIHICPNLEYLKTVIPLKLLPPEFGGEGISLDILQTSLDAKYLEKQELFDKLDEMAVDESLRPEKLNSDEIMGMYGNFKKLDID